MTPIEIRERVAREVFGFADCRMLYGYTDPECGDFCEMETNDHNMHQHNLGGNGVLADPATGGYHRELCRHWTMTDDDGAVWRRGEALPAYETNWGDAGQVVEEMRKRGWRLRLIQTDNGAWFAEFVPVRLGQPYKTGVSDPVAATAISLAALAALEAK